MAQAINLLKKTNFKQVEKIDLGTVGRGWGGVGYCGEEKMGYKILRGFGWLLVGLSFLGAIYRLAQSMESGASLSFWILCIGTELLLDPVLYVGIFLEFLGRRGLKKQEEGD